eukprot:m.88129 g.88129  ORF g.88129 m.88129 type:complete len:213 (-) comp8351_c0_seq5:497-1135(-)
MSDGARMALQVRLFMHHHFNFKSSFFVKRACQIPLKFSPQSAVKDAAVRLSAPPMQPSSPRAPADRPVSRARAGKTVDDSTQDGAAPSLPQPASGPVRRPASMRGKKSSELSESDHEYDPPEQNVEEGDMYLIKRARNTAAVRRFREKQRAQQQERIAQIEALRVELNGVRAQLDAMNRSNLSKDAEIARLRAALEQQRAGSGLTAGIPKHA